MTPTTPDTTPGEAADFGTQVHSLVAGFRARIAELTSENQRLLMEQQDVRNSMNALIFKTRAKIDAAVAAEREAIASFVERLGSGEQDKWTYEAACKEISRGIRALSRPPEPSAPAVASSAEVAAEKNYDGDWESEGIDSCFWRISGSTVTCVARATGESFKATVTFAEAKDDIDSGEWTRITPPAPQQAAGETVADGCPCHYITPCSPHCSCANAFMSGGCQRCCRYGSLEQRKANAERLAALAAQPKGVDVLNKPDGCIAPLGCDCPKCLQKFGPIHPENVGKELRSNSTGEITNPRKG